MPISSKPYRRRVRLPGDPKLLFGDQRALVEIPGPYFHHGTIDFFETAKKIEQAVGRGGATKSFFGRKKKELNPSGFHCAANFTFDQSAHQESQEIDRQQGFNTNNTLQENRHDLADCLELLMSFLKLGLILVFSKQVSGALVKIIGY